MTTGTKLKLLREKKRISQEELAHVVGVSQTTIGNWEHGKSIKHDYIFKLAAALEVPTNYLLVEKQNNITIPLPEKANYTNGFEFIIKAPNNFFEDLNRKIDFLVNKFNQNP
jgi:transcriptional regulator with XRE-family HTH domain